MVGQERLARGGTVAVLVFALSLLSLWFIGPPSGTTAQRQNRPQAEFPPLSLAAIADVSTFEQATAAFSDRLRAKPAVIAALNSAVVGVTGRSPSKSVVASGGQVYFSGEFTEPCLNPEYEKWAGDSAAYLAAQAKKGGKTVLFVVTPGKSWATPVTGVGAKALNACQRWSQAALRRIAAQPGSPVRIIEAADVAARADGSGFWKGDTHWTPQGGLALADLLAKEVDGSTQGRFAPGAAFEHYGDLYALLGTPRAETTQDWVPRAGAEPQFQQIPNGTPWPMTAFTSPQPLPGAPTLLLVYDSFVYAPTLEDSLASLFPSGWLLQWDAMPDVTQAGPAGLVVLESTDRLALSRLASMNRGGPNQPFLDYLASPAD